MADAALQEAAGYMAKAEKALKGGFFKKPDKDTACQEYTKAANAYKKGRAFSQAKDAFIKVGELQNELDSAFHAGKNYENAALAARECKQMEEAAVLFSKAAQLYREGGFADSAAQTLEKAAKIFEDADWTKAVELYAETGSINMDESKFGPAGLNYRRAAGLCCREQKWEKALEMLEKEAECNREANQSDNLFKTWLSIVVLHIKNGDLVAADQVWANNQDYPGWAACEEGRLGNALLNAFDEGDQDQVDELLKKQRFKYLDNEIAKVAKSITVPGGKKKKKKEVVATATPTPTAAPPTTESASAEGAAANDTPSEAPVAPIAPPAAEDEESEDEGLC